MGFVSLSHGGNTGSEFVSYFMIWILPAFSISLLHCEEVPFPSSLYSSRWLLALQLKHLDSRQQEGGKKQRKAGRYPFRTLTGSCLYWLCTHSVGWYLSCMTTVSSEGVKEMMPCTQLRIREWRKQWVLRGIDSLCHRMLLQLFSR